MKKWVSVTIVGLLMTVSVAGAASTTISVDNTPDIKYNFNGSDKTVPSGYTSLQYQGHYYVSARFVAESMGGTVAWDGTARKISVTSPQSSASTKSAVTDMYNYSYMKDFYLASSILQSHLMDAQGALYLQATYASEGKSSTPIDYTNIDGLMNIIAQDSTKYLDYLQKHNADPALSTQVTDLTSGLQSEIDALKQESSIVQNWSSDPRWSSEFDTYQSQANTAANTVEKAILSDAQAADKAELAKLQTYLQAPAPEINTLNQFQKSRVNSQMSMQK